MSLNKEFFNFTNKIKLAFVNALRFAFSSELVPEMYRYNDKLEKSKIAIFREFSKRVKKFPCIIISIGSSSVPITTLHEEPFEEIYDGNELKAIKLILPVTVPVILTIMATTSTDRERIHDMVYFFIRSLFRNRFALDDISYTDLSTGGETTIMDEAGNPIYTNSINVNVYLEIEKEIDITLFQLINSIDLKIDIENIGLPEVVSSEHLIT